MPTSPNPLLKFYPPDEDEEDSLEEQFMDDMINDAALYHDEDGTNKRDAGIMSQSWASKSSNTDQVNFGMALLCIVLIAMFNPIRWHNLVLDT